MLHDWAVVVSISESNIPISRLTMSQRRIHRILSQFRSYLSSENLVLSRAIPVPNYGFSPLQHAGMEVPMFVFTLF